MASLQNSIRNRWWIQRISLVENCSLDSNISLMSIHRWHSFCALFSHFSSSSIIEVPLLRLNRPRLCPLLGPLLGRWLCPLLDPRRSPLTNWNAKSQFGEISRLQFKIPELQNKNWPLIRSQSKWIVGDTIQWISGGYCEYHPTHYPALTSTIEVRRNPAFRSAEQDH